jgi:hypothetical protein
LITLGLVELGLRYFMPVDYRLPHELARGARPSTNPQPVRPDYELKPDVEAYQGKVTTNSYGMRDDEPLPGNRERIVVIFYLWLWGAARRNLPILLKNHSLKINMMSSTHPYLAIPFKMRPYSRNQLA